MDSHHGISSWHKPIIAIWFICLCFSSCKKTFNEQIIPLTSYRVDSNYILKCILSEPLIEAPISIQWDDQGKLWVLEMPDYMPNINGDGEDQSNGQIQVCEDHDGDGFMDHCSSVLSGLKQARSFTLVYGGILYAEPPFLKFAHLNDYKASTSIVVDSNYAVGGNIEHQANGLLTNIDNWIYSAKSNFRYRNQDGKWLKEPTLFRGQWGITHDQNGRLYYNHNSVALLADCLLPNATVGNSFIFNKHGMSKDVIKDTRVYPMHSTAVNRGYQSNVLDGNGRLIHMTSACGPYYQSTDGLKAEAFVCIPEANIVKRLKIIPDGLCATGSNFYTDSIEFLRSFDEAFRPVNIQSGLDESIYVVDMHRGIIQHKTYMTQYLKTLIEERALDSIYGMGRILKLSPKKSIEPKALQLNGMNIDELISLLAHENFEVRKRAQWTLIEKKDIKLASKIRKSLDSASSNDAKLHLVYVLEGINAIEERDALFLVQSADPWIASHGLALLSHLGVLSLDPHLIKELCIRGNPTVDIHLAAYFSTQLADLVTDQDILGLFARNAENGLFAEAFLTRYKNYLDLPMKLATIPHKPYLEEAIADLALNVQKRQQNRIYEMRPFQYQDNKTLGRELYLSYCLGCHGMGGEGIHMLGPPLQHGRIVNAGTTAIAMVVLNGLQGPVHIANRSYDFMSPMPGIRENKELSDRDIASISSFVSNAFSNSPQEIDEKQVEALRVKTSKIEAALTQAFVLNFVKKN